MRGLAATIPTRGIYHEALENQLLRFTIARSLRRKAVRFFAIRCNVPFENAPRLANSDLANFDALREQERA